MQPRRSQKESNARHEERASLAKRIAQALPERNPSLRTASDSKFVPEQPAPKTNTAVTRLGAMALHFAKGKLREAGLGSVNILPHTLNIIDQTLGSRMQLIRTASLTFKATFPYSDGVRVASKGFDVNVSFSNGKFSLDSLQVGKRVMAVHKDVLKVAQTIDEDEQGNEEKENQPKRIAQAEEDDESYALAKELYNQGKDWEDIVKALMRQQGLERNEAEKSADRAIEHLQSFNESEVPEDEWREPSQMNRHDASKKRKAQPIDLNNLEDIEKCPECGSKPGEGATKGCKGCDPVLIHGPELADVAEYNDRRQAQKKNSKSEKKEDIGEVGKPLFDFYKGSSAKVAHRFVKSQHEPLRECNNCGKKISEESTDSELECPVDGCAEYPLCEECLNNHIYSKHPGHEEHIKDPSFLIRRKSQKTGSDEVPDYSNSGTNGWDSSSENDLSQQDRPPDPKEQDLKGWKLEDHSFTTNGSDPTVVGQFTLTKDGQTVEIEEFFGDYKINDEFVGDSRKADSKLQELTGLTLENIYEQLQYEESKNSYHEDPVGGLEE